MRPRSRRSRKPATGSRPISPLEALLSEIQACRACAAVLPLGPRPVLRPKARARLLIVGQAPGTRVHATGIPWNDPSGERLRGWLGVDRPAFYDDPRIAIVPMGFCYPGKGRGGDLPPRPECAALWHEKLLALMPELALILLIGAHAQRHYLPGPGSLTEKVRSHVACPPSFFPLPHPSPRNLRWFKARPWFEAEVVPALRARVETLLREPPG